MKQNNDGTALDWTSAPLESTPQLENQANASDPRRGTNGEMNPLLNKLTPAQFEATVRFYEADRHLTAEDRGSVAKDLQKMVFYLSVAGYTVGMLAFFGPTLLRRFSTVSRVPSVAGLKWRVHRPLLSLVIGWASMMAVKSLVMTSMFRSRVNDVTQDGTSERVLDAWKAMDPHFAGIFYHYFRKTAHNPQMVFPDPRTVTEKSLRDMFYQPGPGHRKDGHFTERLGFDRNDNDDHVLSHWDKIRISNGFGAEREKQPGQPDTLYLAPILETELENDTRKKSAWDSVRNGSK